MRIFFILLILFSKATLAIEFIPTCASAKVQHNEIEKVKIQSILADTTANDYGVSKITLAASIGALDYIYQQKSPQALYEAMYVTLSSDMKIFDALLSKVSNYDINVPMNGATFLSHAVHCGQTHAASSLIAKGADVNIAFHGTITPIKNAIMEGNEAMLSVLIKGGAKCTNLTISRHKPSPLVIANDLRLTNIVAMLKQCITSQRIPNITTK